MSIFEIILWVVWILVAIFWLFSFINWIIKVIHKDWEKALSWVTMMLASSLAMNLIILIAKLINVS